MAENSGGRLSRRVAVVLVAMGVGVAAFVGASPVAPVGADLGDSPSPVLRGTSTVLVGQVAESSWYSYDNALDISDDGRVVAYVTPPPSAADPDGQSQLDDAWVWVAGTDETRTHRRIHLDDGGNPLPFTLLGGLSGSGRHLAYVSDAAYLIDLDTDDVTRIGGAGAVPVAIADDGARVLLLNQDVPASYSLWERDGEIRGLGQFSTATLAGSGRVVIASDSSGVRRIDVDTGTEEVLAGLPSVDGPGALSTSADGSVVAVRRVGGDSVHVHSGDGVRTVALGPGGGSDVSVSADGSRVFFLSSQWAQFPGVSQGGSLYFLDRTTDEVVAAHVGETVEAIGRPIAVDADGDSVAMVADPFDLGRSSYRSFRHSIVVWRADAPITGPTVSVGDVTISEGTVGVHSVPVPFFLSEPQSKPVEVDWETSAADHKTYPRVHFRPATGTLTIPAGAVAATVWMPVWPNAEINTSRAAPAFGSADPTRSFAVRITDVRGTARAQWSGGRVTIVDDDAGDRDSARIVVGAATIHEGDVGIRLGRVPFTLDRPHHVDVIVDVRLVGASAESNEFLPTRQRVVIEAGRTAAYLWVLISPDTLDEPTEEILIEVLSSTVPADVPGSVGNGSSGLRTITIVDDD